MYILRMYLISNGTDLNLMNKNLFLMNQLVIAFVWKWKKIILTPSAHTQKRINRMRKCGYNQ